MKLRPRVFRHGLRRNPRRPDDQRLGGRKLFLGAVDQVAHSPDRDGASRRGAAAIRAAARRERIVTVPVTRQQFLAAARTAAQRSVGLRAGDALHLPVCSDLGATIWTLHRWLGETAPHVGVQAVVR